MQKTLGDLKRILAQMSEVLPDDTKIDLWCAEGKSAGHLTDVFEQYGIIFLESQ